MQTELFIGGEWRPSSDGAIFPIEDPSTEETIAEVANATVEDVTTAVEVAHAAGIDWARRTPRERAEVLRGSWELLRSRREEIAECIGSTAYVLLTAIGGRTERTFSGLE